MADPKARNTRVVVLGGGSGRFTLLEGLRKFPVDISAIVTMTDSGGSSGRLRTDLGVLPPGDIRQCLVALSNSPKTMLDLFNYRFENGCLEGHSFGNILLTALEKTTGSFESAVEEASKILAIDGEVIPVTTDKAELCALLLDGTVIEGETNIDVVPKDQVRAGIEKVYLKPSAKATSKAVKAIMDADIVVIGPGDFYTSVIPNIIVDGMSDAIRRTRAEKVFVMPLSTKKGETDGFTTDEFIEKVEGYCGCRMDHVVCNTHSFSKGLVEKYAGDGARQIIPKPVEGRHMIARDLLSDSGGLARHDAIKTASAVLSCMKKKEGGRGK